MINWEKIKLGKILTESKIEVIDSTAEKRIRVLLGTRGIAKRPLIKETEGATKYFVRKKGQFIYGKQNLHKGAFGIVPSELDGYSSSSDLPAFDVNENCLPEWINYFLRQGDFYISLIDIAKGAATKRIQPKALFEVEIPLPNIEVQRTIIDEFIIKEEKQKELIVEIQTQKQLLTQLKQSILQEAIQGKLTADWREQNPNTEPASELLKRIKTEKDKLIKDKTIKKEKALPPITEEEIPFELPDGWVWCRLGEITTYGSSEKLDSHEIKSDTWVLDLEDIEKESSKILQFKTFSDRPSLSTKSVFKKGWVLYSKLRPYLDKVVVVPNDGVCTTEILPLPIYSDLISHFFMYTLKGKHFLTYVNSKVGGMKMPRLGTTDGKMALIPLAPVEEQKAIVEKVEMLMQKRQALEEEIKTSEANAQMLMQAVLKEAFEGKKEVVCQD
jgi:restriction endonuclease S subunit